VKFNSTEQSITWFRDRYRDGSLVIKPPYQRMPVWGARQKCALVESVLLNLPIPEVYIQNAISREGEVEYAVVDGQQRIRTLLQFIGAELDEGELEENNFPLDKLDASSRWHGKTFKELNEEEQNNYRLYRLSVRQLETASDSDVRDMFRRLNRFLTPLNAQELRNAMYTGPFVDLVNKLAGDEYFAENRIVSAASIRRMLDLQLVSELVIGVLHGPQGGAPRIVDDYYAQYEDYEDEFPGQKQAERLFKFTLNLIKDHLQGIRSTRWSNTQDFYSLFVAVAHYLRQGAFEGEGEDLKEAIFDFGAQVDEKQSDADAIVPRTVSRYVEAVQRGANEKSRRAERHRALLEVLGPFFG
jgi:hypothetical protein